MDKNLSFLGLCRKAGALAAGEVQAENALRNNRGHLLILAEDASDNTKKKFLSLAERRQVKSAVWKSKAELGGVLGSGEKAVLVITDAGMAENMGKRLEAETEEQTEENIWRK